MADSEVSLQGWDAAFAVTYDVMNAAIVAQNKTPASFSNTEDGVGMISGTWGPWQLVSGGAGQDVCLSCPILTGTGNTPGGAPVDLSGLSLKIQVNLVAVEDAEVTVTDPTSQSTGAAPVALKVKTTGSDSDDPPVTILAQPRTIVDPHDPSKTIPNPLRPFEDLFQDWFTDNIKDFGHVFGAAMLNLSALDPNMQWLKPTSISYAVVDLPRTQFAPANGIFATLMMLNNSSPPEVAQQIDPQVLTNLPSGANSVYAISGEAFVRHVLLKGAIAIFSTNVPDGTPKPTADDFNTTDDDQLEVTNKSLLTWYNLDLDDGYAVSPTIPAGGFMTRVVEDRIELNFTGITFNAPEYHSIGNDVVNINYIQKSFPYFHTNADGSFGLTASDQAPGTPDQFVPDVQNYSFSTTLDSAGTEFQKAMMWTGLALSIIPVGVSMVQGALKTIQGAVKLGASLENMANTLRNGRAAFVAADDLSEGLRAASAAMRDTENSAEYVARATNVARTLSGIKGAIPAQYATMMNRTAMVMGLGAAITGGVYSADILEDIAAQNDLTDGVPSINGFLANCLAPTKLPGTGEWTPVGMRLAKSWLIFGSLNSTVSAPVTHS